MLHCQKSELALFPLFYQHIHSLRSVTDLNFYSVWIGWQIVHRNRELRRALRWQLLHFSINLVGHAHSSKYWRLNLYTSKEGQILAKVKFWPFAVTARRKRESFAVTWHNYTRKSPRWTCGYTRIWQQRAQRHSNLETWDLSTHHLSSWRLSHLILRRTIQELHSRLRYWKNMVATHGGVHAFTDCWENTWRVFGSRQPKTSKRQSHADHRRLVSLLCRFDEEQALISKHSLKLS